MEFLFVSLEMHGIVPFANGLRVHECFPTLQLLSEFLLFRAVLCLMYGFFPLGGFLLDVREKPANFDGSKFGSRNDKDILVWNFCLLP